MSEVPDPLARLDVLLEALFMAHTTVYDVHRRLVSIGAATQVSRDLLAESVHIALQRKAEATAAVRRLAGQWHEQSVFDPKAAERTARELEHELTATEAALRALLAREAAITAELRALLADSG